MKPLVLYGLLGIFVVSLITILTLWLTGVLSGDATSPSDSEPFVVTEAILSSVREDAEFCPDPSAYASSLQSGPSTGPLAAFGNVLLAGRTLYNVDHGGALQIISNLYASETAPLGTSCNETVVAVSNTASIGTYWSANGEPRWTLGTIDSRTPSGPIRLYDDGRLAAAYGNIVHVFNSDGAIVSNLNVTARALATAPGNSSVLYVSDSTQVHEYRGDTLFASYADTTASSIAMARSQLVYATPTHVSSRDSVSESFTGQDAIENAKTNGPVDIHYNHRVCVIDTSTGQANIRVLGATTSGQLIGPTDSTDVHFATRYNGFESVLYVSNATSVSTFTAACI